MTEPAGLVRAGPTRCWWSARPRRRRGGIPQGYDAPTGPGTPDGTVAF